MFGKKKGADTSAYDAYQKERKKGDYKNRDVHNEQQMERSEIGERKSMTSRIVLVSILTLLVAMLLWVLFSLGQGAVSGAKNFIGNAGSMTGFMTVGVDTGVQAGPNAQEFWEIVRCDAHNELGYAEFLAKFFQVTVDGKAKEGKYNGVRYNELQLWDVWTNVTYDWHWPGYCSLFDPNIESPLAYQAQDAAEGRPEYVDTTGGSGETPEYHSWLGGDVEQVDPNAAVNPDGQGNPSGVDGQGAPVSQGNSGGQDANLGGTDPGASLTPVGVPEGGGAVSQGGNQGVSGVTGEQQGEQSGQSVPEPVEEENIFLVSLKSAPLWKVFWTLFLSAGFWLLMYAVMKKNLDAQNQLYAVDELNQYKNDQHIQFPEEMMAAYDWFPDVGCHSPVQPSSTLSHVMLTKKGIKHIPMAKRAEKDITGADGEIEYLKGEILLDADGNPVYETVPLIDEKFADGLYDSAKVDEDKALRVRYDATKIPYNPDDKDRDKLKGAETVAQMIDKYWTLPDYEPQRPAGAYLVDTAPANTMV